MWGFPKIRGTLLGVPIIRTLVFGCLYWGPPILGNYHITISFNMLFWGGDFQFNSSMSVS